MTDRFEEMRTFVAVVEEASFAKAADRLGLVRSAVSRRVQEMEVRLGAKLLQRTTRHIALTDIGQRFFEQARAILLSVEQAEQSAIGEAGLVSGVLKISAPVSLTTHCLAPLIGQFIEQHPLVSILVDTDDRHIDLIGGGYDLAIRIASLKDSSLIVKRLTTIRHICCASPAFLDIHGRPDKPDDLVGMPGLQYSNVDSRRYWMFRGENSPRVESRLILGNGDAIREAAISGAGVAMLPTFIAHEAVRRGDLEIILRDHIRQPIGMYAVYSSAHMVPGKMRAFIDFLAENFGAEPFWDKGILSEVELAATVQ